MATAAWAGPDPWEVRDSATAIFSEQRGLVEGKLKRVVFRRRSVSLRTRILQQPGVVVDYKQGISQPRVNHRTDGLTDVGC